MPHGCFCDRRSRAEPSGTIIEFIVGWRAVERVHWQVLQPIVRPNLLSLPETLGNWADGRISCRHWAPPFFLLQVQRIKLWQRARTRVLRVRVVGFKHIHNANIIRNWSLWHYIFAVDSIQLSVFVFTQLFPKATRPRSRHTYTHRPENRI